MKKHVTMADVAHRAGVSKTAVSLVLNERPGSRLSDDLAVRVRAAAAELNYRPNPAARSLRIGKTQIVGFISDDVTITRYASAMIRGALDVADQLGHTVLIAETGSNPDRRQAAVQAILDRRPDGLVFGLMGAKEIDIPEVAKSVPLVVLNGLGSGGEPHVAPAEFDAGTAIAGLLVAAGHRRIGIVGYPPAVLLDPRLSSTIRYRIDGVESVLEREGVVVAARSVSQHWEPQVGHDATADIIGADLGITALICMNDRLAFGAYQAIQERGLAIPDDISVASFDDDEIATYLRPQLTTARLPYEQMGRDAMTMLLKGDANEAQTHLVPMPVQLRDSVGVPAHGLAVRQQPERA
jgi:LacI family transcriptional regulator